jgi:membrane protein
VTLLFGASGMFGQLQSTLNRIWGITPKPGQGLVVTVKQRFFSFAMVLGIGFLLLASVIIGAALAAFNTFLSGHGLAYITIARVTNDVVSFVLITLLFALIYKVIPDVKIAWRDVWIGAALTAALFSAGKWAIGLYVTKAAPGSAYGAAGSLIVLLVWIYYSAQILYLGAELTEVYASHRGSQIMASGDVEGLRRQVDTAPELRHPDPLISHKPG